MSKEAKLKIDGLTKSYGGKMVLDNLSIKVEEGEMVSLLGPSGSGKSTFLHCVAGITLMDKGHIYIDGSDVSDCPARKRNVGVVFQNFSLFSHMTVFDNIAFPLRVPGRKFKREKIKEKVLSYIHLVKLEDHITKYPSQLSGGQQQRVAIARALIYDPDILLYDEPLGSLDKRLREEMLFEIRKLHSDLKKTSIFVTHDQLEAFTISNKIVLLNHGKIEQIGTPYDLYESPSNLFVGDFLGESNLIVGKFMEQDAGSILFQVDNLPGPIKAVCSKHPDYKKEMGERCTLLLRPEKLSLKPVTFESKEDNVLEGVIQEMLFLGSHIRTRITINPEMNLIAYQSNNGNTTNLNAGKEIKVHFLAKDVRIVPNKHLNPL